MINNLILSGFRKILKHVLNVRKMLRKLLDAHILSVSVGRSFVINVMLNGIKIIKVSKVNVDH